MRRVIVSIILIAAAVVPVAAAFELTASKVTVQNLTVDKYNYFVTVDASTSSGEYEVAFDVWPRTPSVIGDFSSGDKTIGYVSSYVHKTRANGNAVDMWYSCQDTSAISLHIVSNGDGTCTLSGSIQAVRNGTSYTYIIRDFEFSYTEEAVTPGPDKDPYRFEPAEAATVDFSGDVIHFREREGYIEVTLNEMANESYDWVELRLLSTETAMPAGVYTIDDSGEPGTLTASKGYLGTQNDDPCYVAIRADKEQWGSYTPYYLVSGSLTVSYNAKGDTITIAGEAQSHNGSDIHIYARSYNMLYVPEEQPKEPEDVTLAIDTVVVTYMSTLSDEENHRHVYTLDFSAGDDYPNVIIDLVQPEAMTLSEGTYTLSDGSLSGLMLSQNQADFEANIFAGGAYDFTEANLVLSRAEDEEWQFEMTMHDAIGSTYRFSLTQNPHITYYPQEPEDPKDRPYADEQKETATVNISLDTIEWNSSTVEKDGILDIILGQKEADINGLRAYVHLGMYTSQANPEAGVYPVADSEAEGTFSASPGRYGNTLIPCYALLLDNDGWAHAVWYITGGAVTLSYDADNQPLVSGECTTYFGSTIRFCYTPQTQGIDQVPSDQVQGTKVMKDGVLYLMYKGRMYDVRGNVVK